MPNIKMADQPSGVDYLALLLDNALESYEVTSSKLKSGTFQYASNLKNVTLPPVLTSVGASVFFGTGIETIHFFQVGSFGSGNSYDFRESSLKTAVIEKMTGQFGAYIFANCAYLEVIDIGDVGSVGGNNNGNNFMNTSPNCKKLILRNTTRVGLSDIRFFQGSAFASGGAGGTIYIPKSLYDHLGDGTSNDYKALTNWATVDGYGTITWAKIEGTAYDGYWADGTPITA